MVTSQMRMYCSKVTCVPGRSLLLVSLSFVVVSATPAKPYEVAPYIGGNLKQRLVFMFISRRSLHFRPEWHCVAQQCNHRRKPFRVTVVLPLTLFYILDADIRVFFHHKMCSFSFNIDRRSHIISTSRKSK